MRPSPVRLRYTYWKPSAGPQMSAPAPFRVKAPPENVALPALPTAPTSRLANGDGRPLVAGVMTETATGGDVVRLPELSVATAVSEYCAGAIEDQSSV